MNWKKLKDKYPHIGILILAYVAFIALGMPDGLFGVAWPSIRISFFVPLDSAGLLIIAGASGYLTSSFLSGPLISRFGVGFVLSASCVLTGISLIGYTIVPFWWMMILLGVILGLGAGAIDAGLNNYVAAHFKEGLMQWLHASYGIGITLGPLIMTATLVSLNSWRVGYCIVGWFQILLAACFVMTLPVWDKKGNNIENKDSKNTSIQKTTTRETLHRPQAWLSGLMFLIYNGSEVALGTWAYTLLTESRGTKPEIAGLLVGSYWGTFTVGRFLAGFYAKRAGVNFLVTGGLVTAILGTLLLWWNPATITNLIAVALIGFAIAPIFPAMISTTSKRVGVNFASNTIGLQMALGSVGAAAIPGFIGVLARQISIEVVPVCLFILFSVQLGLYLFALKCGTNNP